VESPNNDKHTSFDTLKKCSVAAVSAYLREGQNSKFMQLMDQFEVESVNKTNVSSKLMQFNVALSTIK
jgi:hypothetical protein